MQTRRIMWADIAKFFAIVLMVSGHLGLPHHISNAIHMFHMPIFFIMGGYFYSKEKYQKFTKYFLSRVKSLLVPYFVWGVISYGVYRLIPYASGMTTIVTVRQFVIALFTQDANIPLFSGFGVIQWFFTSLFFSEMIMWGIIRVCNIANKQLYFPIAIVFLIFLNFIVCSQIEPNWLGFKSSILGALFCLLGFVLKDCINKILEGDILTKLFVCIFTLALVIVVFFLNGSVNMRTTRYNNSILFVLGALSGSLLVFIISRQVEICLHNGLMKKFILYIGRNTALILCTNRLVQYTFILLLNKILSNFLDIENGIGLYMRQIFDLIMEMLLFVPIIYIVNRWIPFTLGRHFEKGKCI